MKINDLSARDWRARLANSGACIRTHPFTINVSTNIPFVPEALRLLYGDYEILEHGDKFIDFHVSVRASNSIRRWLRPLVFFSFDGKHPFKPLPQQQALPVFEWGLNWCIATSAHQYLMIHAAVIEKEGKAVILPGSPGSGKSTLCAGLVSRGWRLLSDEMTLIDPENGLIVPVPRPISLKNQSIDVIQGFAPDMEFGPACDDTHKGRVAHIKPPGTSILNASVNATPAVIVFPKYKAGSNSVLKPLSRNNTVIELAKNAFNFHFQGKEGFRLLTEVVSQCDSFNFSYSDLSHAEKLISQLVVAQDTA